MSGAANAGAQGATNAFSQLASAVDCGGLDADEELSCVQNVPALRIQDIVQSSTLPGTNTSVPRFGAVVDNVTVFANNTERLEKNLTANVPLITGYTTNENAAFGGYTGKNQTAPPPVMGGPGFSLGCSVKSEIETRLHYNLPTYRYLFAGNFSNITPRYWLGAMHSSDLPIVFGTHNQFRGNSTDLEWATSYAMQDFWGSFVVNAMMDPTDSKGVEWPQYAETGDTMVVFGGNGSEAVRLRPGTYADGFAEC
ncbi:unnamed protein product [Periconia digitata]|uniref:Carboxylesterase type B domain-containing protein n=1 Tax=Periconia digitata TaxID=1303443 RepID=A0A9W4XJI5_9PLEO|nr:unnamed protein product [Periconia digitata]